jgi:GTP-binding protein
VKDWQVIQGELAAYSDELAARPQLVVASKAELPGTATRRAKLERFCAKQGLPFFAISSVTGQGLGELIAEIGARLRAERWAAAER